jgi:hypothetical protein
MKNSKRTIGNRTSDLPVCSTVPQPTALQIPPFFKVSVSILLEREMFKKKKLQRKLIFYIQKKILEIVPCMRQCALEPERTQMTI